MRKREVKMTDYEEVLRILNKVEERTETEIVDLVYALGRVNAHDIVSDTDFPPFDRSAMDGFAFRYEDLKKMDEPIFTVKEVVLAGHPANIELAVGECVRIMTGGKVPYPCDTVIEFEKCEEFDGKVRFLKKPSLRFNVAVKGEDLHAGEIALKKGERIAPKHVNLLASLGIKKIEVKKKVKIGVISTGDELIDIDEKLTEGKIRNSSKYALFAQITELGQEFEDLGTVRDNEEEIAHALENGLRDDVVLITGGSSVGDKDFTVEVLKKFGADILVERVAIKPGRPTIIATIEKNGKKTWIFGMPGNPVSTFTVFKHFVALTIERMLSSHGMAPILFEGVLDFDFKKKGNRLHFVPCAIELSEVPVVKPLKYNGSGDFTGLSRAQAFFLAPKGETVLAKGSRVKFYFV